VVDRTDGRLVALDEMKDKT